MPEPRDTPERRALDVHVFPADYTFGIESFGPLILREIYDREVKRAILYGMDNVEVIERRILEELRAHGFRVEVVDLGL